MEYLLYFHYVILLHLVISIKFRSQFFFQNFLISGIHKEDNYSFNPSLLVSSYRRK